MCDIAEASMEDFKQELAANPKLSETTVLGKLIERQVNCQLRGR
jgi:hypothetical protein